MRKRKRGWMIFIFVLAVISIISFIWWNTTHLVVNALTKYALSFDPLDNEEKVEPFYDEEKNEYYFITNKEFKIMQLTDIHLGGGSISYEKDKKALNAIDAMISYEKPDLVIITGDSVFPMGFMSGSFNNRATYEVLLKYFENKQVYFSLVFGNHDSELYSLYNREAISKQCSNKRYKYCLYTSNYENQIYGYGNQKINIYNRNGLINKTLYLIDSNSYLKSDLLGIKWEYDNVHEDQIEWYKNSIIENNLYNQDIISKMNTFDQAKYSSFKQSESFIFQHIPLKEYKDAYLELLDNNYEDTENAHLNFGSMGENPSGALVYGPKNDDNFFETIVEMNSTKAIFCGHDHLNNYSIKYKGVDLTYGLSIDYLAYANIDKYGYQRGCTIIKNNEDGSYSLSQENYYQKKYVSKYAKETVKMIPLF